MSKLSEEEREALRNFKSEYETCNHNSSDLIIELDDSKIILNLIEEQSKEIEELKEKTKKCEYYEMVANELSKEIERLEARKYMLNAETGEISQIPLNNNYISKDKIKAKIEECREILYSFEKELELKGNKNKFIHKESMNCLLGQISILQSLLEEE